MTDEFKEKIKKMDITELRIYRSSAKSAGRFLNVCGIGTILFMMSFSSLLVVIPCTLFVLAMAHMAVGVTKTLNEINERILKLSDK